MHIYLLLYACHNLFLKTSHSSYLMIFPLSIWEQGKKSNFFTSLLLAKISHYFQEEYFTNLYHSSSPSLTYSY